MFAAVDTMTGHEVAVKVFDKAAMIDVRRSMVAEGDYVQEKAVYRVQRRLLKIVSELEISKSLDHPNIIKYLGAYETSHRVCIVHELVEGSDLLEHLLANGKMKEAQAAHVFRQLLSAVHYCHERHVYHRDLKLEKCVIYFCRHVHRFFTHLLTIGMCFLFCLYSVLITPDFHVKLIDFGLSEIALPGETLKTVCGTPLYCSPEVLFLHPSSRKKGFHGGPADVWSIGVLIFALLTGCAPFDDSNFVRLREEVYRNSIAYPGYMSDEVKGLLKSMLIFDAQLRPTVKDILSYGWLKAADEKLEDTTESNNNGSRESTENDNHKEKSPEWSSSSSPLKGSRPRSLSCLSQNGTEGTSSTSGSFEDSSDDSVKPSSSKTERQTGAAEAGVATHLSCLENDLDEILATGAQ